MLDLEELNSAALWRAAAAAAVRRYGTLDEVQFRRAAVHEVIDLLVGDLIQSSRERLAEAAPASAREAAQRPSALVTSSPEMALQKAELQRLLFDRVYRHPLVLEQRAYACEALHEMFQSIVADRRGLPNEFAAVAEREGLRRAAVDYLAGMTDRFALEEHDRLVRST
jgi:dGTPase